MSASTLLTVPEVADALGVSRRSIYEGIRRDEIPVVEVGRAKRVPLSWLTNERMRQDERMHRRIDECNEVLSRIEAIVLRLLEDEGLD